MVDRREDWFDVDFDDNTDGIDDESALTGVPASFLGRLRDQIPRLTALGYSSSDAGAWYEDGALTVTLHVADNRAKLVLSTLRLEISDAAWRAGWVASSRYDQPSFEAAFPVDESGEQITAPERGVQEALDWLLHQAGRPIVRRIWRRDGEVFSQTWDLEDTGRGLAGSGPVVQDAETPDETVRVRP